MGMLNKKWGLLLLGAWLVISGVLGLVAPSVLVSIAVVGVIVQIVAGALIVLDK
jgi:hypothetical protein